MSAATVFRIVATVVAAAATALQPVYGKQPWYVAVVAVGAALALVSPSLVRKSASSASSSSAAWPPSTGGTLSGGGQQ
jgi:hypothetical protein